MDSQRESDCPCFPPPPEFHVPPPPNPFSFMHYTKEHVKIFENDESCPLYILGGNVDSDKNLREINEPLYVLIIITSCLVLVMSLGGFIAFLLRKRRCLSKDCKSLSKKNVTYSNYSSSVNGVVLIPDEEVPFQIVGKLDEDSYFFKYQDSNQPLSLCDTYNPVYEEISLCGLPVASAAVRVRNGPVDYLNQAETNSLLNAISDKGFSDRDMFKTDNDFLLSHGINQSSCKCSQSSLPEEIYLTNCCEQRTARNYQKAAFV